MKIDLMKLCVGFTKGFWEILEAPFRRGRVTVAKCRCHCGAVREVNLYNLMHRETSSCGCAWRHSGKKGDRHGRWQLVSDSYIENGRTFADCECECGIAKTIHLSVLVNGQSKSCGCGRFGRSPANKSHGRSPARLYRIWAAMKTRCTNKTISSYKYYGGKGIAVCREWSSFEAFREWALSKGYNDSLSIERRENSKGYTPDNCEWIPLSMQTRNRTISKMLTAFGVCKDQKSWSDDERCMVSYATLRRRIIDGWSAEETLARPLRGVA